MKLHQLRFVREIVRQKFNLTAAAQSLHTSQPGVSRAVIELEEELGVEIFQRHGKRIRGLSPAGEYAYLAIERAANEIENLKRIGREFSAQDEGTFVIATTHTQARYVLPRVVRDFSKRFVKVKLKILEGNPHQVAQLLQEGVADVGIATEVIGAIPSLVSLPCYQWQHCAIMALDHPLARVAQLALEDLIQYRLITYEHMFAGRSAIDKAFAQRNLTPDILLEAIDADVIKEYVELGLGVGIIAGVAFDAKRDKNLAMKPVGHLFGTHNARIGVKRGSYLRAFVYDFFELLSPKMTRDLVEKMLSGKFDANNTNEM